VECFLRQDYPPDRCELIVLDDAGQYVSQSHTTPKSWHLVSVARRFATLGEKRNASAAFASADVDALVVWDDDDIYLPWALRAHAAALEKAPWSRPSQVLVENQGAMRLKSRASNGLFHPAWAFTREAFRQVRGYPFMQSGQDQGLARLFQQAALPTCDAIELGFSPFLFYRWGSSKSYHLSGMNAKEGYERLETRRHEGAPIERVEPQWEQDYLGILPESIGIDGRRSAPSMTQSLAGER
jgi:hypothetical protein